MVEHKNMTLAAKSLNLPGYVDISNPECQADKIKLLHTKSNPVTFPLTDDVRKMIEILVAKFDHQKHCVGLAAPQIGFPIQAIVFEVKNNIDSMKWHPDLDQTMAKTVWLNPRYEPASDHKNRDFEGCFSASQLICDVDRYSKIKYSAFDLNGDPISGQATGFLARVIQHEVDHINGILCIDKSVPGTTVPRSSYHRKLK